MSRYHQHDQPINSDSPFTRNLPPSTYGVLVGTVDGPLTKLGPRHVGISIRVASGEYAGLYQAAFNVESEDQTDAQYATAQEPIGSDAAPPQGFDSDASLSYVAMGLTEDQFSSLDEGSLQGHVMEAVRVNDLISVYGWTYDTGDGIHDIHMNSGEKPNSGHMNRPNQDGALAYYYSRSDGQAMRGWIFIKFETQELAAAPDRTGG